MLTCLIFPISINHFLIDRHNHISKDFLHYDLGIYSKQDK